MGNLCWGKSPQPVIECIQQMQQVEKTLGLLVDKYEVQIREQQQHARKKLYRKTECMRHMRTIHIIRHHKQKLEARLTSCMDKRYHLESLNVTKMHIEAVKTTGLTFKRFLKEHDIQRVEQLQETLTDMIEDACEINDTLSRTSGPFEVDDSEVEDEYEQLCAQIQMPEVPTDRPQWGELHELRLDDEEETSMLHTLPSS